MPISFKDSGLESLFCSCLTEQAPIDSKISPAEPIGLDPVIIAHDVSKQCALERNQHSSDSDGPLEMNPEYGLFPHSLGFSHDDGHQQLANADQDMPVFEGFFMQAEHGQPCIVGDEISFNELDVANSTIKRDGVLEQLCRSSGIHTPSSQISNSFCGSVSDELQKCSGCMSRTQPALTYDDCSPFSSVQFAPDISIPCTSPGKIWEGFTCRFSSGSSERKRNSNPELTCYPIKEEDNGNIDDHRATPKQNKLLSISSRITNRNRHQMDEIRKKKSGGLRTETRGTPGPPAQASGRTNRTQFLSISPPFTSPSLFIAFASCTNHF